jgi:hypothetical protein
VTTLESFAFSTCANLATVTFAANSKLEAIENNAFRECTSLTSVIFQKGGSLKSVKSQAFLGCTSLKTVQLPDTVTVIGPYAFYQCSLNRLVLPKSLAEIGSQAFNGNKFISIEIPETVRTIDAYAFYDTSLASVTFAGNSKLRTIGTGAFTNCHIAEIHLPASITTIENSAFLGCSALANIYFDGTTAEWATISKGTHIWADTKATYIQCIDGKVTI